MTALKTESPELTNAAEMIAVSGPDYTLLYLPDGQGPEEEAYDKFMATHRHSLPYPLFTSHVLKRAVDYVDGRKWNGIVVLVQPPMQADCIRALSRATGLVLANELSNDSTRQA